MITIEQQKLIESDHKVITNYAIISNIKERSPLRLRKIGQTNPKVKQSSDAALYLLEVYLTKAQTPMDKFLEPQLDEEGKVVPTPPLETDVYLPIMQSNAGHRMQGQHFLESLWKIFVEKADLSENDAVTIEKFTNYVTTSYAEEDHEYVFMSLYQILVQAKALNWFKSKTTRTKIKK